MSMIDTEKLRDFIELCCITPYIKNGRLVSALVIGRPESGKTKALFEFRVNDRILYAGDINYSGLVRRLSDISEGRIKTIIIPDLLKPISKKRDTAMNFVTLLNELVEEGIGNISGTKEMSIDLKTPARANVIAAITDVDFLNRIGISMLGFTSRFVPFSYKYSDGTIDKIFDSIMKGDTLIPQSVKIRQLKKPVSISIKKDLAQQLLPVVNQIKSKTTYGFRLQESLMSMAQANALLHKRKAVIKKDIDKLVDMSKYMNFDFNTMGSGG